MKKARHFLPALFVAGLVVAPMSTAHAAGGMLTSITVTGQKAGKVVRKTGDAMDKANAHKKQARNKKPAASHPPARPPAAVARNNYPAPSSREDDSSTVFDF